MTTMIIYRYDRIAVLLALLGLSLLLQEGSSRSQPWSLPTRFGPKAKLLHRTTSSNSSGRNNINNKQSMVVLGLKGGDDDATSSSSSSDTTTSNKIERTEDLSDSTNSLPSSDNASDEISRGGGATAVKHLEVVVDENEVGAGMTENSATEASSFEIETSNVSITSIPAANQSHVVDKDEVVPEFVEQQKKKGLKKFLPRKKEKYHKQVAKKLKNRNARNLRRKVMHAGFGLFFASLNHFIPKDKFVPGMAILSSATLMMELLRYRKGFAWMNHALHFVLGKALRKHEMDGKFTGSFYFFTGVTATAALYPKTAASLGIMQLAIADPSASYFGRATRHVYWSRIENGLGGFGRNKGILGFLGGALFCVPFNYRMLSIAKFGAEGVPGGRSALMIASLALGFAGAFADLAVPTPAWTLPKKVCGVRVPPLHLDDNFVVPVVSGFACTQVFKALGWDKNLELATFLFL